MKFGVIITLIAACFVFFCLAVTVKPSKAESLTQITVEGVSLRMLSSDGNYGLRFSFNVTGEVENLSFGTEIKPQDLSESNAVAVRGMLTEKGAGAYSYTGSIIDIKEYNRTRPYHARGYYETAEGEKVYTEWSEAVSIYALATRALADCSNDWTDIQDCKLYLESIVDFVQGNTDFTNKYVKGEFNVNFGTRDKAALYAGDVFSVSATTVNNTNAERVLKVYPVVTVTDAEGADITDNVIEQVSGTQDSYRITGHAENFNIVLTVGTGEYAITETVSGCNVFSYNAEIEGNNLTLKVGTENRNPATAYTDYSFYTLGMVGQYDTVKVYFTGKNIPNFVMFSDTPGGQMYGGGNGYAFIPNQYAYPTRFYASGPNRAAIDANQMFGRNDTSGEIVIGSTSNDPMARGNLEDGTEYVLSFYSYRTASTILVIINLDKTDGTNVYNRTQAIATTDEGSYASTLYANGDEEYYVILYGHAVADVVLSYEVIKDQGYRAFANSDGSYTLKKGTMTWGANGSANSSNRLFRV